MMALDNPKQAEQNCDLRNTVPKHVAIIMDGNGRWAKQRNLPRIAGHRAGIQSIKRILPVCEQIGVEVLTLYAFSVENWTRPRLEIKGLMGLLIEFIDKELQAIKQRNARISVIGDVSELSEQIRDYLNKAVMETSENTGVHLNLAINYGGRQEILRAVNQIVDECRQGKISVQDINNEMFANYLYTKDLPDPDLIVRTSGEKRLSNFLLWQLSYSEIYGTDVLWPDFSEEDFLAAIGDYQKRERRYGDVGGES